jgi:hypothetical protein
MKQAKGMSVEVIRNGDKPRMTAGPTEFIENNSQVSLGVGPVSVSAGRSDSLKEYKLRTADFASTRLRSIPRLASSGWT